MKSTIEELKQIHICGRTTITNGAVNLFWGGSGLDFCFSGSEIALCYEADFDIFEPWISVLVDGAWILRMPTEKGIHTVTLLRGMDPGTVHRIQVLKDDQAMSGDRKHRLSIMSLIYNGKIEAPPAFDMRIEIIGDSITSGEGVVGAKMERDWITALFSLVPSYGRLIASALNADYRIISQSGCGIASSWDNNPVGTLASCYEYICNITDNITSTGSELHAHDRYDFTEWPADVVLVNLGTNDEGAFHNPAFVDSETGIVYQNKMLSDGNYDPQSIHKVIEGQKNFIKTIRKNNPNAMIIWCYGMCGKQLSAFLEDGVMEYCRENQDENVFYLELPEMTEETIGSREHPGPECHIQASKVLSTFIYERT